jgi:hypothetical protein
VRHLLGLQVCLSIMLASCAPAKSVPAIDLAKTAVIVTDAALASAITATTDDDAAMKLIALVPVVKGAADAIEKEQGVCPVLPDLHSVAVEIKCTKCQSAIDVARKELACPQ